MAFPPTLFLIGAQKSGTTKLADLLDHHDEISLGQTKEPAYFTRNFDKGIDWYRSMYEQARGRYLLDASVTYSQVDLDGSEDTERVPKRIFEVSPQAKFLYLIRNPVDRMYSAFMHMSRTGRETRSIEEVIAAPGNYLFTGDYAGQARCYLRFFPRESFLFIRNDDLASDPQGVFDQVCEFLELPTVTLPPELLQARHNVGFQLTPAGRLLWKLTGSRSFFNRLVGGVRKLTPQFVRPMLARVIARPPRQLSDDQRARLLAVFQQPIDDIEQLSGLDLSAWRG